MSDIKVKQLYRKTEDYAGQTVTVRGWVRNNRNSNAFGFIELNDGSFFKPPSLLVRKKLSTFRAASWQFSQSNPLGVKSWVCSADRLR